MLFGYQVKSGYMLTTFNFCKSQPKQSFRTWFGIQRLCFFLTLKALDAETIPDQVRDKAQHD